MPFKFIYFDLGKVLVDFDIEQMLRQISAVAGVDRAAVLSAVFESGLQRQYEEGRISSREFCADLCRRTGSRADCESLARAAREIFTLNVPMLPVVTHLFRAGYRLGVLSNTCENHWEYCLGQYGILGELFSVHALSHRIGACKPDAAIFHAAAEMAGCRPEEIFFCDDTPGHVVGARAAGFDAVQFTSAPALAAELRQRGVRLDY